MWAGAFLSFCGSWVQMVAQGWLVYELTGDKSKLALVGFVNTIPVALSAPIMGALVDTMDRRKVLVFCQCMFSLSAFFMAIMCWTGQIRYEHILCAAFVNGLTGALEMPTRQSIVSRVVPLEQLHAAIPLNAMTFNLARILGPSVGGLLYYVLGPTANYTVNGFSYIFLIGAVIKIKADISSTNKRTEPVRDLIVEGMRYTWREPMLRTLFIMEMVLSIFALFYLNLLSAYVRDVLKLDSRGLGVAMTTIGLGAITGLIVISVFANRPVKSRIVQIAMVLVGVAVVGMSLTQNLFLASLCFALAGAGAVAQFNTTGALFQILAPERMRGRVISMHVWALSGIGPLSLPLFGWLAEHHGLQFTMGIGGGIVLVTALGYAVFDKSLHQLDDRILEIQNAAPQ